MEVGRVHIIKKCSCLYYYHHQLLVYLWCQSFDVLGTSLFFQIHFFLMGGSKQIAERKKECDPQLKVGNIVIVWHTMLLIPLNK